MSTKPDLILLDVMLPVMDGFQVCKKVRECSTVPIVMLTAKEEEVDKVLGLELGADDYITKPFGMRELIARIKANIRRTDLMSNLQDVPANVQEFGNLAIDMNRYEVRKDGVPLELTLREFELLKYLAERENRVFSREQLLEEVWGYEYYGDIRTVDVTVRRLREKLEDDSSNPKYIMTKRASAIISGGHKAMFAKKRWSSIRFRIVLIYFLLVFIAMTVIGVFITDQLEAYQMDLIRSNFTKIVRRA